MKTKLFSIFLLLSVTVGLYAYDFKVGDLCYNITDASAAIVEVTRMTREDSGNYPQLSSVTIPKKVTYNGTIYNVKSISKFTFMNCTSLTSVTIPNSVTTIEDYAFSRTILTSITIPNSVTTIKRTAFDNTLTLVSVVINSDSITSVNRNRDTSFRCIFGPQVSEYILGDGVYNIGDSAFCNCTSLTSVTMPDNLTNIGSGAFQGCTSLTSVTLPDSLIYFDSGVFQGCTSLTSVTMPDNLTNIGSGAFQGCTSLTSVTLPDSLIYFGYGVFQGCTSLTSVAMPNSLTAIGSYAFQGCTSLTSVTMPDSLTDIGYGVFQGCTSLAHITIPDNVRLIGDGAFQDCTSLTSVAMPDSLTKIFPRTFQGCTGLTSITIPGSVRDIGDSAFEGCSSVESIIIEEGVRFISSRAFLGCSNETLIIPRSVLCIYSEAFAESALEKIIIKSDRISIGKYAFRKRLLRSSDYIVIYLNSPAAWNIDTEAFDPEYAQIVYLYVPCIAVEEYKTRFHVHYIEVSPLKIPTITAVNGNGKWDALGNVSIDVNQHCPTGLATITAYSDYDVDSCIVFSHWDDGVTDNPRKIVFTQDTTIMAHFDRHPYEIAIDNNPEFGTVSVSPKKKFYCNKNNVAITVTPNDGYIFKGWSDGNSDNPRTLVVTDNVTLSPVYEKVTALDGVVSDSTKPYKVIYQGQMYIIRNGVIYTATGAKL